MPSNVRIYFHARQTLGSSAREVFDLFSLDRPADVLSFELRFVRSAVATLTLFARTLTLDRPSGRFCGLDFEDVWLDKDAVLAPDGTIFFVDLEGLEEVRVEEAAVREKLEDQVYRSLYEFMFGFEQIEQERARRFGERPDRRAHFERVLAEAVKEDPFVRLAPAGGGLDLIVRNALERENLYLAFRIVDR